VKLVKFVFNKTTKNQGLIFKLDRILGRQYLNKYLLTI